MTPEQEQIDLFLKSGPKIPFTDKSLFKLVCSDDERELRTGIYRIHKNGIFIREEEKTDWVLKYPYIRHRFVVEQWFPPSATMTEELPLSAREGSYEPIYVFEDKDGNELPLSLEPVQFIVRFCMKPGRSEQYIKSVIKEQYDAREKAQDDREWDLLNDEGPLISQFHDGSAILNPLDIKDFDLGKYKKAN